MAEGEFFKAPALSVKEETELYDKFDDLIVAYRELKIKIDHSSTLSYEQVIPLKLELFGSRKDLNDTGMIGLVKERMMKSGMSRLPIANDLWMVLNKIEEYMRWAEGYFEYNEKSLDGLDLACKSAFKIISNLYKEIDAQNIKIKKLENRLLEKTEDVGHEEAAVMDELEKERFHKLLKIKVDKYSEALLTGVQQNVWKAEIEVRRMIRGSEYRKECVEYALKKAAEDLGQYGKGNSDELPA